MKNKKNVFDLLKTAPDKPGRRQDIKIEKVSRQDIAVIGIGLKFALAGNAKQFWQNLREGVDCIGPIPESRKKDVDAYSRFMDIKMNREPRQNGNRYEEAAYLEEIDAFDYRFFGLSPREAELMDPNQRLFLETAWTALEDAGYGGRCLEGTRTGVYVGFGGDSQYKELIANVEPDSLSLAVPGNLPPIIASRLSYLLDFKGPNLLVNTVCSSSLVAVHLACRGIRDNECDLAVAGGVQTYVLPIRTAKVGIESSDFRTKTFDHSSDGTGSGEGIAAVLLKPLNRALIDRDHIYAVIKGTAVNQDGRSIGITAPNPAAQEDVICRAWQDAGIDPETISYIEAHGTGTPLGDPIEIEGIRRAFARYTEKTQFCAIGSAKSNMGHLDDGAGIAGLIKAVLALKNKEIPPTLHFHRPNRKIPFHRSPLYVNDVLTPWENSGGPRRCGVSSFSFSGTNCHLVLEETPLIDEKENQGKKGLDILTLSAETAQGLQTLVEQYKKLKTEPRGSGCINDICFTANSGRGHYTHRLAMMVKDGPDFTAKLTGLDLGNGTALPDGVYYRVQPSKSTVQTGSREEADALVKQVKTINKTAAEKVTAFRAQRTDEDLLRQICLLYTRGAEIDWDEFYHGCKRQRVSLPAYPFQGMRCWLDIPVLPAAGQHYFTLDWKAGELPITGSHMEKAQGSCLIVKPRQERGKGIAGAIVNGLRRQGVLVLEVDGEPGPGLQADYERLRAGGELKNVRQIIHLQSITGEKEADSPEELEKQLETGVYSLFYLVRALQDGVGHRETIDIVLISDYVHEATGRERCIHPGNAALFGLGKVVNVEYFNFRCRSIDIDGDTGVDDIMTEIAAGYSDYKVAYRGGKRYVEELESVDILKTAPRTRQGAGVTIKPEGVYIITGGTGGLGLEIAGWLALQGSRHIALINRSKIPDRSQWPGIIESGRTPALAEKIKCIQQIEKKGAALVCCPADVSNPGELEKTLGFLREKFGKINGIVHSAAVGSGQAGKRLSDDDPEIFRLVMAPKARGTWLLDRFTREDHLDFFVVFSGAITLVGGIGSGSYTAGNTYLNSFAQYRKKTGRHTAAMGWAVWEGSLKKYDIGFDSRKHLFEVQSTAEILQAFAEILESNVPLVIFGRLNHKSEIFHLGKRLPLRLSAGLPFPGLTAPPVKSPGAGAAPVELTGRPRGNYPEVEQQMAQVFGEFLGYREINVYDNFYELGGDSIIAAKMIQAVNHRHQLSLAVEDLLRCPTVAELGDILKGKNSGAAREKTLQQTLPAEALTAGRGYLTIQPVEKKEYYPAAEFQKTAHILSQLKGSKVVGLTYNLPVVMVVEGDIDKKRFSHIFQVLAQRHEALRTSFTEVDKQTVQRIHDKVFIPVDFIEVENDRGIDALVTDFIKPFDLGQAPLFRVQLAKLPAKNSPRRHLLLMDIHHGVSDGQSGMNLLKDFTDLYGNKELPELPVQFKDFINCRHQACNRPVLEKQEAYWLEVFKGGVPALNMPLDRPRPWMQSFKGDNVYTEAGEELSLRLNQVASRAGVTSFIVLLAAFQVLLSRYTGNEDMVIGVPVANRRHPQLQPLVGSFVNMLPLRNAPGKSKTFKELLNQVKANVIEAFENQDYFFGELIRRLGIQKELGRNPFYDVMLAMQIHEKPVMETKGLTFTPYPVLKNSADIDLTLDVKEKDKQLVFRWEYCSRLYNRETIEGLAANYTAVLEHITRDLNIFITDIAVEPRDFYRTGETAGKKYKEII